MNEDTGSIVTVDGRIAPEDLGVTLAHEHIFIDQVTSWFEPLTKPREQRLAEEPVTLENLSYVRTNPLQNKDNMMLDSTETALDELSAFARAGGGAVVDLTPTGIGADPEEVRRIGRGTGLDVVHGTAYYTYAAHPDYVADMSLEEIADTFVDEVRNGIAGTDVRAGMVGEVGLSGSIHEQEERVLRAGARAALRTGASLNIHPPLFGPQPTPEGALAGLDIVEEEGLPLNRVVMSHMDQDHAAMANLDDHRRIADRGAYLEFDQWHAWSGYLAQKDKAYPSDATRVDALVELIDDGYLEQLLIGHDVCTKMQLETYGGKGYVYYHDVIVPWLRSRGVTPGELDEIMIENPRRVLTFDAPDE